MAVAPRRGDAHLWVIALGLSLFVNLFLLGIVGFTAIETAILKKNNPPPPPPTEESVATILAEVIQSSEAAKSASAATATVAPAEETAASGKKQFARTSPDQAAAPEKPTPFIGERATRATSDRAPTVDAPPLPSQAGRNPRDANDIETTQSTYQDGKLDGDKGNPTEPTEPETTTPPAREVASATPTPRDKLMDGPNPVDVQVPQAPEKPDAIQPAPTEHPTADQPPEPKPAEEKTKAAETPKPKTDPNAAFKGNQHKTAVIGSISRTGRSALDVEDSPLGRYQAAISRAVELEWQRNCVRHRDFITPGFLTVRFFVQPNGKVRSVQFVGEIQTGEIQKGFTLNAIRDAEIPAMPPALRKDYTKEPLELIFRFFF